MGKILITGGAGFIGAFLGQRFARDGHTVHLVDNLARGRCDAFLRDLLSVQRVEFLQLDLLQPQAVERIGDDYTHIVHLAAILGVQNVLQRPFVTLRDNFLLLDAILACVRRQSQLERFVFASTSEVYAGALEHLVLPFPTPESTPLALPDLAQPRTSYMLSKIHGEAMVRHSGAPFTIVRPHNVYGPRMGMSHVVPELLRKAHAAPDGGSIEVYSVDHRRTFCFVDDAVDMISSATTVSACLGATLNVGSQSPEVTMGELAEIVIRTVGKSLRIDAKPATAGSPSRRCPDMARLTQFTGCRAQVPLEVGVRRTYDWYRARVFEGADQDVAT